MTCAGFVGNKRAGPALSDGAEGIIVGGMRVELRVEQSAGSRRLEGGPRDRQSGAPILKTGTGQPRSREAGRCEKRMLETA